MEEADRGPAAQGNFDLYLCFDLAEIDYTDLLGGGLFFSQDFQLLELNPKVFKRDGFFFFLALSAVSCPFQRKQEPITCCSWQHSVPYDSGPLLEIKPFLSCILERSKASYGV